MEASQNLPEGPLPEPGPAASGELVVQNGRQSGVRRPLTVPLTLIGRAPSCDVRLNAKDVHQLHCALVQGPAGLLLRNLQAEAVTLVNGEPAADTPLREGDLLSVGPFQFRIRLPQTADLADTEALRCEQEALRVQAAAVAAQQTALTEEEGRLQQKRIALQKQEEQLAAHLEEKRQQLEELREQVREARAALRKERAAHAEEMDRAQRELEQTHRKNLAMQQRNQVKRQRLLKLQRGLKRRWQRHAAEKDAVVRRREEELQRLRREVETWKEQLQHDRARLVQEWLRFNGEVEVGRRQLTDNRNAQAAEQRQWSETRARQQSELRERGQALEQRAAELARDERELARRIRQWEGKKANLEREVEGLENRVRHQRRQLQPPAVSHAESAPAAATVPAPSESLPPAAPDRDRRSLALEGLAAELADQRLQVLEQFERLLRAQQGWQQDRDQVARELEQVGLQLSEREHALNVRELAIAPTERALASRREEATQIRLHLQGWRSRLAARESAWEAERDRVLAEVAAREKVVEERQQLLAELRQRWGERRLQEFEQLRTEQNRHRDSFHRHANLWTECYRRSSLLEQEQRALAEKSLALEQYRLEVVGHADNPATAEKRLERLRRRWASLSLAVERRLAHDRKALEALLAEVEDRFLQLHERNTEAAEERLERAQRQTDEEQSAAEAAEGMARLQQSLHSTRAQRDLNQWQLDRLRDEMERMALTLIDEADGGPAPSMQAA